MKSILNLLLQGLGSLLSGFKLTGSTSTDGSTESTGNGAQNDRTSRINWTGIILVVLVGVGLYLIPSPLQNTTQPSTSSSTTSTTIPGIPDTNYTSVVPITGEGGTTVDPTYVATLDAITIVAMPDLVETLLVIGDKEADPVQGIIRATAYPYVEGDTLKIDQYIEYNIEPKPIMHITQIDTFRTIDSVFVEQPRPWTEEPLVVAGGTSVAWALLLIILL